MFDPATVPLVSGSPYQRSNVDVAVLRDRDGNPIVEATFGNRFSETNVPMTRDAALALYHRLGDALLATR